MTGDDGTTLRTSQPDYVHTDDDKAQSRVVRDGVALRNAVSAAAEADLVRIGLQGSNGLRAPEAPSLNQLPIELNVGGEVFTIGPRSVAMAPFLLALCSNIQSTGITDAVGRVFIDRDPAEFRQLLDYLRDGELALDASKSHIAIQVRRIRKVFTSYGVSLPPLCVRCRTLFDPARNATDACVSHPAQLRLSKEGSLQYPCCGLPPEALGCHISAHQSFSVSPPQEQSPSQEQSAKLLGAADVSSPKKLGNAGDTDAEDATSPVWRVRPEEGRKVPLVVDLSPSKVAPGSVCIFVDAKDPLATDGRGRRKANRKLVVQPESQVSAPSKLSPPNSPCASATKREQSHRPKPYDFVCRPSDCPKENGFELVDLVCDVDIESLRFPRARAMTDQGVSGAFHSREQCRFSQISDTAAASAEEISQLGGEADTQGDRDSDQGDPCWLYTMQQQAAKDSPPTSILPTRTCQYFSNARCQNGGQCQFLRERIPSAQATASVPEERLFVGVRSMHGPSRNPRFKTRMCPLFRIGACARSGADCKFAHGLRELRGTSEFFKTQLCSFWAAGYCRAGSFCRHAHGPRDLRVYDCTVSNVQAPSFPFCDANAASSPTSPAGLGEAGASPRHPIRRDPPHLVQPVAPTRTTPVATPLMVSTAVGPQVVSQVVPPMSSVAPHSIPGQTCRIVWLQMGPRQLPNQHAFSLRATSSAPSSAPLFDAPSIHESVSAKVQSSGSGNNSPVGKGHESHVRPV